MTGQPAKTSTRIITEVDFDRPGKQVGALFVPRSTNETAWGAVRIPILVINNGESPTLLLTGGTHGDEYEGQIALIELARAIEASAVRGRVVIIPALHYPACEAGTRTSPIDGRDLNRSFPGDAGGSFAQMIAHYVTSVLLPMSDVAVDIHSGGRSLDCIPCTMSHILDDVAVMERTVALANAFGAPFHVMNREVDGSHTFASTAESLGVTYISSELGGCNRVSLEGLAITRRGIRNVLVHLGLVDGEIARSPEPTRRMKIPSSTDYGFAPEAGIYVPRVPLGSDVQSGDVLGEILSIDKPMATPHAIRAKRDGMLWCQRGQGRIGVGDCSAVVVQSWNDDPR